MYDKMCELKFLTEVGASAHLKDMFFSNLVFLSASVYISVMCELLLTRFVCVYFPGAGEWETVPVHVQAWGHQ